MGRFDFYYKLKKRKTFSIYDLGGFMLSLILVI